jgi:hypothetical protein
MKLKLYYYFIVLTVFFACSCTFQQRLYRPGFTVSRNGENAIAEQGGIGNNSAIYGYAGHRLLKTGQEEKTEVSDEIHGDEIQAVAEVVASSEKTRRNRENPINNVCKVKCDSCDLIVLRNGDEISALVKELTPTEVKYKRCDMPGGPMISIYRNDILFIRYADGTKEVFKQERVSKQDKAVYYHKSIHPGGVLAMVAGLVGLIIFGIPLGVLAITMGISSLAKITREGDRLYGRAFGVIAIIIGTLDVIGVLIYLSTL